MQFRANKQHAVRLSVGVLALLILVAACQSAPPTQYLLEVTREVTRVVIVTATAPEGASAQGESAPDTAATPIPLTPETAPADATLAAQSEVSIPTPVSNQIVVSEQEFQNGRMFWLEPSQEIWVLVYDDSTQDEGIWLTQEDTWDEAVELAFDPSITPPNEDLFQPERGFGKIWRENQSIQDAVGWAISPEAGHVTTYAYVFRGEVTDGAFQQEPGYHTLVSRTGDTYLFDAATNMWQRLPGNE